MLVRYLQQPVTADLQEKMVFVAGPRQVGKTTLARQIIEASGPGVYRSWDRREDRRDILAARWPPGLALLVLDELHKYRHWKRWIKGAFDAERGRLRFLVTGSARLDVYRRGGDSLQGRYHHYRLHPFTYAELERPGAPATPEPGKELPLPRSASQDRLDALMRFGGFPEPLLAQSERALRRWQKERVDRFFREDVRDLEALRDLSSLQLLADLLGERVASPLSLNSLREDLEVSHRAVTHWVAVLDRLYYAFLLRPHVTRKVRALRKMPKAYLWDPTLVTAPGPRFENLVALHLLKLCHLLEDQDGHRAELSYLRDADGREVDFLVTLNGRPWFAVEAKLGEERVDPALRYYKDRLAIPWVYQAALEGRRDIVEDGIRRLPARILLAGLV